MIVIDSGVIDTVKISTSAYGDIMYADGYSRIKIQLCLALLYSNSWLLSLHLAS